MRSETLFCALTRHLTKGLSLLAAERHRHAEEANRKHHVGAWFGNRRSHRENHVVHVGIRNHADIARTDGLTGICCRGRVGQIVLRIDANSILHDIVLHKRGLGPKGTVRGGEQSSLHGVGTTVVTVP